jgi:hypothetical protein
MFRSPFMLSAVALSLAGIAGQVVLYLDSDDGIGMGLLSIIAGNGVIGIIACMRVNPIPLTWKKATAQHPVWPWPRHMWAPAGLALAVQVTAAVLLALYFGAQGLETTLTALALGIVVAVGGVLAGFLVGLIVGWPIVVIGSYLRAVALPQSLRASDRTAKVSNAKVTAANVSNAKVTAANVSTARVTSAKVSTARPEAVGPLLSAMLLLIVALAIFGVAAVSVSPSDSSVDRGFAQFFGVLFDYSTTGAVDQPLAWVARGCALALLVVTGLMLASWSRYDVTRTAARRAARKARAARTAAEKSTATPQG